MSEADLHRWITLAELMLAGAAFVALLFVTAPYGRHRKPGWGPTIPNTAGWIVMESPAVVLFAVIYALGEHALEAVPLALAAMWMVHYVHRTFVYPLQIRTAGKRMPVVVAALAFGFNCLNAYVVGRWISHFGDYPTSWLWDPRFLAGTALFALGLGVNRRADRMLIRLRGPGETGYRIPRGSIVLISPFVTHRHPRWWRDPERFDPDRFLPGEQRGRHRYAYFPFSGGPRVCLGGAFAMLEMQLVLATLAQRFELVPAASRPFELVASASLYPRGGWSMSVREVA